MGRRTYRYTKTGDDAWGLFCARWRAALRQINRTAALLCGGALMLAGMLVRGICGSPWGTQTALLLGQYLPSVPGMTLLWSIWYGILGVVFGAMMFSGERCGVICLRSVEKYRGAMYFLCMILLGFLWYPLFFVASRLALAAVLCVGVTVLAVLCGVSYWKIAGWAGVILWLHALFLACMSVYSIAILFVV